MGRRKKEKGSVTALRRRTVQLLDSTRGKEQAVLLAAVALRLARALEQPVVSYVRLRCACEGAAKGQLRLLNSRERDE